jgi:membrane-bound lytic murein transglycosylase B
MGGSAEMAGAWIDSPGQASPQHTGHGSRAALVTLAVVAGVIVLAVLVWVRFLSGVAAGPVPASVMDGVPAVVASPSASAPPEETSGGGVGAVQPQTMTVAVPRPAASSSTEPSVDAAWLSRVAAATGISRRALQAYAGAELELEREEPSCRLGWNTLAGIGKVESNNGRALTEAGYSRSPILGPTVQGDLHAEGPMQFMPGTWARWGADGNGDGISDPNQIDDAALAAAHYLCSYGKLDTTASWHAAVFGYNHLESYVAAVAAQATLYAQRAAA